MVDDGYRIIRGGIDAVQHIGVGFRVGHLVEVVMGVLEQLHQIRGGTGLKPVVSEFHLGEGVQETERIVHSC